MKRLLYEKEHTNEEAKPLSPLPPLQEIDRNVASSSESESEIEREVLKPQKTLIKKSIDVSKLLKYLDSNVYDILSLPFSFKEKQLINDKLALEYLEVYQEETKAVQKELCKHDNALSSFNIEFTDRLLWLSAKTVEGYLNQESIESIPRKSAETSPTRKVIHDVVRNNLSIQAKRMKERYSKRKRLVVKEFCIGDNVAVRIPVEDRAKTDPKRIPALIVKVRGSTYKLTCRYGTIGGYYSASDLIPYPGHVAIANEENEITLRKAATLHSQRKSDVLFEHVKKLQK